MPGLTVMAVLGIVAGALLLLLLAAELALRLSFDPASEPVFKSWEWQIYDPVLSWCNREGVYCDGEVRINSLGFRGEPTTWHKPPGVFRIVCLGDSCTFGFWVSKEYLGFRWQGWVDSLRAMLRDRGYAKVEVINAAAIGYTTSHGLRQLQTVIPRVEPDLVAVRLGFNDHSLSWDAALRAEEPDSPVGRFLLYRLHRSHLLRLALRMYQKTGTLHAPHLSIPWVSRQRYRSNLRRFAEVCDERSYRLLLIDYPLRPIELGVSDGPDPDWGLWGARDLPDLHALHDGYQEDQRRTAEEVGIDLLATRPAFDSSPEQLFSRFDLVHPNDKGARLIAAMLVDYLESKEWFPHRQPPA